MIKCVCFEMALNGHQSSQVPWCVLMFMSIHVMYDGVCCSVVTGVAPPLQIPPAQPVMNFSEKNKDKPTDLQNFGLRPDLYAKKNLKVSRSLTSGVSLSISLDLSLALFHSLLNIILLCAMYSIIYCMLYVCHIYVHNLIFRSLYSLTSLNK